MPARTPTTESLPIDINALSKLWAGGSLAYNQWLITLLDAQTAWCRDAERWTANLMQGWLGSAAQPPTDAALGLMGPAALQRSWAAWTQVWVDALRHDATER